MSRTYTEARKRANIKYMQEKTDDIRLRLPKGTKERWKLAADKAGVSMTKYVQDAVEATIKKDGGEWISVKDRLPDKDPMLCLVFRPYDGDNEWDMEVVCYRQDAYWWDDVTHWMPLPETPHNDEKAGE